MCEKYKDQILIVKVINGYLVKFGSDTYIAASEYQVSQLIANLLPLTEGE